MDGVPTPDESLAVALRPARSQAFKPSQIFLTLGLVAWLANLVLAGSYFYEIRQQSTLATEIAAASDSIAELPEAAEAHFRLTQARSALAAEQRAFSTLNSSPAVTHQLLALADSTEITVLEVVTAPGQAEKVDQNSYGALLVTLQVAGSAGAISTFLNHIEDGFLPGGRLDSVDIERIPPPEAGAPAYLDPEDGIEDSGPSWSSRRLEAAIGLTVFERQGSWD
jgi:hypothetical protein